MTVPHLNSSGMIILVIMAAVRMRIPFPERSFLSSLNAARLERHAFRGRFPDSESCLYSGGAYRCFCEMEKMKFIMPAPSFISDIFSVFTYSVSFVQQQLHFLLPYSQRNCFIPHLGEVCVEILFLVV
jgi:hypothetical protein